MGPECADGRADQVRGEGADHRADPFDGPRTDLLGLGFGVHSDAGVLSGQKDLEWEDRVVLLVIGTTASTPRPSRAEVVLARPVAPGGLTALTADSSGSGWRLSTGYFWHPR